MMRYRRRGKVPYYRKVNSTAGPTHEQIGRAYIETMLEQRDSDEGVPVAYTEFKTFSDHRRLIRQAVEIGATMA